MLAALKGDGNERGTEGEGVREEGDGEGETKVVLVSWLRDKSFWREGGRRIVSSPFPFSPLSILGLPCVSGSFLWGGGGVGLKRNGSFYAVDSYE